MDTICASTPVGRNELAKCGFGLTSMPPVPSPTSPWSSFSKNSESPLCFAGMCRHPSRPIAPALENPSFHGPHLDLTTCPSWPLPACLPLLIHSPPPSFLFCTSDLCTSLVSQVSFSSLFTLCCSLQEPAPYLPSRPK